MINMVVLSGFAVLTAKAVNYSVAVYPNIVAVGDTVTVSFINTGVLDNEYRVGYSLGQYGSVTYLNNNEWTSDNVYTFIPPSVGRYWVWCHVKDNNGSTNTYRVVDVLESSEPESSEPESSEPESSEPESSFDSMNWMPSNWQGDNYVQPSADSTPDISFSLPSDIELSVSGDMTGIISSAFQSLPSQIFALLIPTVIALFIGWWLHK